MIEMKRETPPGRMHHSKWDEPIDALLANDTDEWFRLYTFGADERADAYRTAAGIRSRSRRRDQPVTTVVRKLADTGDHGVWARLDQPGHPVNDQIEEE